MICNFHLSRNGLRREKPLIVVSVSSPYDFALDASVGTYICSYDFTDTAVQALVKILYGEVSAQGALPGTVRKKSAIHR